TYGIARAVWAVGVDSDLVAGRVCSVDDRLHFLERDRLSAGDVVPAPRRAEDLYPIRAGIEHGLGFFGGLRRSIRDTGPSYDVVSEAQGRHEHAWADHGAHVDEIAHGDVCAVESI